MGNIDSTRKELLSKIDTTQESLNQTSKKLENLKNETVVMKGHIEDNANLGN